MSEYTSGSIAALIVVPLVIAGAAAGAWALWRLRNEARDSMDRMGIKILAVCCALIAVGSAVGLWWGMYPWKVEYHEWRQVSGTVNSVDSRIVPGMEDKFVVTFKGNPQQYGVFDTRTASVRPGDKLIITCVRRWQWVGTHGYDCEFVDYTPKSERRN